MLARFYSFPCLALLICTPTVAQAADLVQLVETSLFAPPSPDPAGIAFVAASGELWIADSEVNEMPLYAGANLFRTDLGVNVLGTATTVGYSNEPTGVTWDPASGLLFLSDDDWGRINLLDPGPDTLLGTADDVQSWISTWDFGSNDAEGLAFDLRAGTLFVTDGAQDRIYEIDPGPNGVFDGVAPGGDDLVQSFDALPLGISDPEGIAYDVESDSLLLVGQPEHTVFQCTTDGTLLRTLDISAAAPFKPAGLTLAPRSDDPSARSLYIVDRGADNNWDPSENDGRLYELEFPAFELELSLALASDDAEEDGSGAVDLFGLELGLGSLTETHWTALRFSAVDVPRGAVIHDAWIQFESAATSMAQAQITLQAEASDDAAPSTSAAADLSSRPRTQSIVTWNPPTWGQAGLSGPAQATPDLSGPLQEVISRAGWQAGQTVVVMLTGISDRTAAAHDADPLAAPSLHLRYFPYAPLGSLECDPAVANSTGLAAEICASGSPRAISGELVLTASQLPPGQFGYFLTSLSPGLVPQPGGSQGNLCLGGQIGRFNAQAKQSDAAGQFSIQVDTSALPPPLNTAVSAGETWYFQCWYRDVSPTSTSNFTPALAIPFE